MDDSLEKEQLEEILESFCRMHPLKGVIRMHFAVRKTPDSDGQSVIHAFAEALDTQSLHELEVFNSNKIQNDDDGRFHLQMLEESVPSNLLGYQYIIELEETPSPTSLGHVSIKNIRKSLNRSMESAPLL